MPIAEAAMAPLQQFLVKFEDRTHVLHVPTSDDDNATKTSILNGIVDRTGWPLRLLNVLNFDAPFCTVRVQSSIRGGKGGFGTLLKGQSRQAGAKLTTDFGACRDLQGRRLRHVNDEIKLRRWRERQRKEKNGVKVEQDELWKTPSGIYNWHLMVPTWADISKKSTDKIKRQFQQIQKEQDVRDQRKKDKERVYQDSVTHYTDQAKDAASAAQSSLKDAIRQGLESKKKRKRQPNDVNAAVASVGGDSGDAGGDVDADFDFLSVGDSDQPGSLVTLSGDVVVLDDGEEKAARSTRMKQKKQQQQQKAIRIQSKSEFGTSALVLDKKVPDDIILYYEIKLITGGFSQIGWASLIGGGNEDAGATSSGHAARFAPNDDTGDGVGDDAASYGFDPCRQLKFHAGEEEDYGTDKLKEPAEPGDVMGCSYDLSKGTISFSVNGKDLGVAFHVDGKTSLFPAFSCNQDVAIEVRTTKGDCEHLPKGKTVHTLEEFLATAKPTPTDDLDEQTEDASNGGSRKKPAAAAPTKTKKQKTATDGKEGAGQQEQAQTQKAEAKPELLDLSEFESVSDLEALGLDRLKGALLALRCKCSGTLQERAERLFSLKGLARKDYPLKVRAKNFFR